MTWKSKKQDVVSRSSAESEYRAYDSYDMQNGVVKKSTDRT